MEYRKNDIVTLEIVDCGTDGEGIGKADGFTVFVKDAVIGDTIMAKIMKAKKNYGYGRLMEILKPSRLFLMRNRKCSKKRNFVAIWNG